MPDTSGKCLTGDLYRQESKGRVPLSTVCPRKYSLLREYKTPLDPFKIDAHLHHRYTAVVQSGAPSFHGWKWEAISPEGEGQIAIYCMSLGSVPGTLMIPVFKFNPHTGPTLGGMVILI